VLYHKFRNFSLDSSVGKVLAVSPKGAGSNHLRTDCYPQFFCFVFYFERGEDGVAKNSLKTRE